MAFATATEAGCLEEWRRAGLIGATATWYGNVLFFRNDVGGVAQSLVAYGEWAENELAFLRRLIPVGSVVIDVGAYVGTHTLAFSAHVGSLGRVYSIEAQPRLYCLLDANVRSAGAANVVPISAVAGARDGAVRISEIAVEREASFGSSAVVEVGEIVCEPHTGAGGTTVQAMTLDGLGLTSCALIKIDVEGMESAVLEGATGVLEAHHPIVYAECNSVDAGAKVVGRLWRHGYAVLVHVVDPFNGDNWRGNGRDIFHPAREVALVGVPPDQRETFRRVAARPCEMLFEATSLDDLSAGMLLKPQYWGEVLRHTSGARAGALGDPIAEAARAAVEHASAQVAGMLSSTSWRVTRPLRALRGYFRRAGW